MKPPDTPTPVAEPGPVSGTGRRQSRRFARIWWYLGPAFVASVAYMDPGNFATNIEAGSRFGYELLWVLLWSNAMAILIQYLAAKLGIATGRTLPECCRDHFSRPVTVGLWVAGEISAMATDLAEFLGAALGFYLLFHMPLMPAALLTGFCVFLILLVEQYGFRHLELEIMTLVGVIGVAYAIEVLLVHPAWGAIGRGILVPEISASSIYIAVGMLGATVMPHVIYLHSALVLPRRQEGDHAQPLHRQMAALDVLVAMNGAWLVNSAMVVMAAAAFFGHGLTVNSIRGAHTTLEPIFGGLAATAFAIALLASGLSSSTVGTMAGQVIISGFLKVRFSIFLRRLLTMIPSLVVIAMGLDPLKILILSQVALSFCLPFALIPLLILTRRRDIMGIHANTRLTNLLAYASTFVILALNALLIAQAGGLKF